MQSNEEKPFYASPAQKDHQFQILFVTGRVLPFTWDQAWRCLSDRYSIIFFAITGYVFGVLSYYWSIYSLPGMTLTQVVTTVGAMVPVAFGTISLSIYLLSQLSRVFPGFVVPIPLVVLVGVLTAVFTPVFSLKLFNLQDWYWHGRTMEYLLQYYLIALALEAFYTLFVLPRTKVYPEVAPTPPSAQVAARPPAEPGVPVHQTAMAQRLVEPSAEQNTHPLSSAPATSLGTIRPLPSDADRTITIKNEVRLASEFLLVRADEHYVHLKTKREETMIRMKISHLVADIPESFGMIVHRSYWVAFEFIDTAVRERNGKLLLTLKDGQEITVPRARAKDVEGAWRGYLNSVSTLTEP